MTRLALAALTRLEQGTVRLCRALARPLRARVVRQMLHQQEREGKTENVQEQGLVPSLDATVRQPTFSAE